jgi:hypothetical protein
MVFKSEAPQAGGIDQRSFAGYSHTCELIRQISGGNAVVARLGRTTSRLMEY